MAGRLRHIQWLAAAALLVAFLPAGPGVASASPGVAEPFVDYYSAHQGLRVLGHPLTDLVTVGAYPSQYFEKGRIEDHSAEITNPNWAYMYGLLTSELIDRDPKGSVSGTNVTYGDLAEASAPSLRVPAPAGFTGGTAPLKGGRFVPFDTYLRPAPGYIVAPYFWSYINRADLFPGGWLHDMGLPVTPFFDVQVNKKGEDRTVTLQAFERAVLSYDPLNPSGWQVERGNIGADALRALPGTVTPPKASGIVIPAAGAQVMVPVHVLARVGQPGDKMTVRLTWQDGTKLTNTFTALRGEDGRGLVIGNLDWINMLAPPEPDTQPATLEIIDPVGKVVTTQQVTVISPNAPNTMEVKLYWTVSGTEIVQPQTKRIIKTAAPAAAALEELLWGPPTISQVGFRTAIPTPDQVLSYPGRQADWGPRVTLRGLKIENGVATADFSKEIDAYGGGSARVALISQQIVSTLKQFPSVRDVVLAVEGRTGDVLQP